MINFFKGGIAKDQRGQIRFVNEFDMSLVKRFYIIKNEDLDVVRGWRAHRIEQRWFYILSGSFQISLVRIDNWEKPQTDLEVKNIILSSNQNQVLHIPPGYATAFKSLEDNSEILVFADHFLKDASDDDYTYDLNYFVNGTVR